MEALNRALRQVIDENELLQEENKKLFLLVEDKELSLTFVKSQFESTQNELLWEKQKSVALNERIHTLSFVIRSTTEGIVQSNQTDFRNFSGKVPDVKFNSPNSFMFNTPINWGKPKIG